MCVCVSYFWFWIWTALKSHYLRKNTKNYTKCYGPCAAGSQHINVCMCNHKCVRTRIHIKYRITSQNIIILHSLSVKLSELSISFDFCLALSIPLYLYLTISQYDSCLCVCRTILDRTDNELENKTKAIACAVCWLFFM